MLISFGKINLIWESYKWISFVGNTTIDRCKKKDKNTIITKPIKKTKKS